jgi:phage terminase large subunit
MGVEEIIKWTQLYPGSLGVIGRLTAKSLRETTQRRFFEVCDPSLIEEYNKSEEHMWIRTNAVDEEGNPVYSEILFYHLDDPGPLGSLDISYFWIDEAHEPDGAEVPEATFQMLTARLRHPVGPWRGFVTSNSGGKDWVWDRFFNPKKRATYTEYIGWNVPTRANAKYLPPGYEDELRKNNPPTWVSRFLDGSFDAFEGQVYTDFDEAIHVYKDEDVDLAPQWDYGAGFDFGVTAPTACVYGCVDHDGDIWMYAEDYEADADIEEFAHKIKNRGFTDVNADPATGSKGPNKKSPRQLYQEFGVNLLPASNDEDYFMKLFINLLKKRKKDGTAVIHISSKCVYLIDQIKKEAWDPLTLKGTTHDKLKKQPNHARDAFKYFLNTYGMHPGLLNPVLPGRGKGSLSVGGEWEHPSYEEDEDFDRDDYVHMDIKRRIAQ